MKRLVIIVLILFVGTSCSKKFSHEKPRDGWNGNLPKGGVFPTPDFPVEARPDYLNQQNPPPQSDFRPY